MKKFKKFVSAVSHFAMFKMAALLVVLGASAVSLCAFPFWHNEPEMPQSMLDEIMEG